MDPVEQVARALCDAIGVGAESAVVTQAGGGATLPAWRHQLPRARVAYIASLKAIREPGRVYVDGVNAWQREINALIAEASEPVRKS